MDMNSINSYVDELNGYERLLSRYELYQQEFLKYKYENATSEFVSYSQLMCLDEINRLIEMEEYGLYSIALNNIGEELLQQKETVEMHRDQLTINDLTITRITNTQPAGVSNISTYNDTVYESPQKKMKISENNGAHYLVNEIKKSITIPNSTGLCTIAGLKKIKELLVETAIFPLRFPHLFTDGRRKVNKALLYGPPGTGKTQLAHSLAAELQAQFYNVSSADLFSRYIGESEKLIKTLFQHCLQTSEKCLIFIDEIDSLCRNRSSTEADHERRAKNQLLIQLSELDRESNQIFFLAATNCPWDLDAAFIRRFEFRIYIPLPDRETRQEILNLHLNNIQNLVNSSQWADILRLTQGWSGSDITNLVNCAMHQPLKDLNNAKRWILTSDNKYIPARENDLAYFEKDINDLPVNKITVRPVEVNDFFVAFQSVTKSVASNVLARFEEFNQSYGTLKKNYQNDIKQPNSNTFF